MIEASSLEKRFGEHLALDGVSFRVEKGQIVGFLGANGAGKTTTMDILCGCLGATRGSAVIAGHDIAEEPLEVKKRIGYLPDEPPLHNDMRVRDFIEYAGRLHKMDRATLQKRVPLVIEQLSLGSVEHRLVGNLSKGYRQRVGLAQALIHDPEVLILDEPTEGLDPIQIIQIRELIRSFKGSHTILFSSHILSEVESICDELIIIHKGKVVEQGRYQEIMQKSSTHRQYELQVRQGAAQLKGELERMPGLLELRQSASGQEKIEFILNTEEASLDEVIQRVLAGSYGIEAISPKSKSLEDVFFQLAN